MEENNMKIEMEASVIIPEDETKAGIAQSLGLPADANWKIIKDRVDEIMIAAGEKQPQQKKPGYDSIAA